MNNTLINNIRTLTGRNDIELSNDDVTMLTTLIENADYSAETMQGAVFATAVMLFDKTKVVIERNQRETDLPVIAQAITMVYDHYLDGVQKKDFMWFLEDTLEGFVEVDLTDLAFAKAVVKCEEVEYLFELIDKLPD